MLWLQMNDQVFLFVFQRTIFSRTDIASKMHTTFRFPFPLWQVHLPCLPVSPARKFPEFLPHFSVKWSGLSAEQSPSVLSFSASAKSPADFPSPLRKYR